MSPEQDQLLHIQSLISSKDTPTQEAVLRVKRYLKQMLEVEGEAGVLALALVGSELAAENSRTVN